MPTPLMPPVKILALLTEAPAQIAALTAQRTPEQLRTPPSPEEWSANEVLAHLRACADVWGGCMAAILAGEHPILRAVNPRTWIERTDYRELEFTPSLDAYTRQRAALIALLQPLSPAGWARTATITGAGKPLVRSVHFYADWLAGHERPHRKQIAQLL